MKKLFLLIPLFAVLILTGCIHKKEVQQATAPVVTNKPVEKKQAVQPSNPVDEKDLDEEDHPHDGTEPDEHHDEDIEDNDDTNEDHPHDGTEEEGHDDDQWTDDHGDVTTLFAWATFSTSKEQTIDGYDIVIKHKDDIHAWDKITWTITVTKWGNKIDGFEKIDGDDGVWIVKDPTDHLEHLHPLAFTDNTLTFSSHSHDAGVYEMITQFKHNGKNITVLYKLDLLANETWHGHE